MALTQMQIENLTAKLEALEVKISDIVRGRDDVYSVLRVHSFITLNADIGAVIDDAKLRIRNAASAIVQAMTP